MRRCDLHENETYAYLRAPRAGRWADLAAIPILIHDMTYPRPGACGIERNPVTGKPLTVIRAVVLDPDSLEPSPAEGKGYHEYEIPGLEIHPDSRLILRPWSEHILVCAALLTSRTEVEARLEAAKSVLAHRRDALVALLDPADVDLRNWLRQQRPLATTDDPASVRLRLDISLGTLEALIRSARRAALAQAAQAQQGKPTPSTS